MERGSAERGGGWRRGEDGEGSRRVEWGGGGGGEGGAERELGMEPTSEFSGWPTITTFSRKGIHVEHQSIFTILNEQHHEICWPKLLK